MRINWLCLLILLLSFSCAPKKKKVEGADLEANEFKFGLKLKDSITIKLDSLTPSQSWCIQYIVLDTVKVLAYQNRLLNEVVFFNLDNRKQILKVRFDKEGPYGIGNLSGFYILNKDTLVVAGHMKPDLFFFNLSGEWIGKVQLNNKNKGTKFFPMISHELPYIKEGHNAILPKFPTGNWSLIENFSKESVAVIANMNTGSCTDLNTTFPKGYYDNGVTEPVFSRLKLTNSSRYIYSFYGDHNLYMTDDHNVFDKKEGRSVYVNSFIPGIKNPSMEEYLDWLTTSPAYLGILEDPYRGLLYRFVSLGDKDYDKERINESARFSRRISVIIFDKSLNFLGEYRFPVGKYYWKNSFVTEDGLYVSSNSPFNKAYNSEVLNFGLFEIVQL